MKEKIVLENMKSELTVEVPSTVLKRLLEELKNRDNITLQVVQELLTVNIKFVKNGLNSKIVTPI